MERNVKWLKIFALEIVEIAKKKKYWFFRIEKDDIYFGKYDMKMLNKQW